MRKSFLLQWLIYWKEIWVQFFLANMLRYMEIIECKHFGVSFTIFFLLPFFSTQCKVRIKKQKINGIIPRMWWWRMWNFVRVHFNFYVTRVLSASGCVHIYVYLCKLCMDGKETIPLSIDENFVVQHGVFVLVYTNWTPRVHQPISL